jgi:hypothetical protein
MSDEDFPDKLPTKVAVTFMVAGHEPMREVYQTTDANDRICWKMNAIIYPQLSIEELDWKTFGSKEEADGFLAEIEKASMVARDEAKKIRAQMGRP